VPWGEVELPRSRLSLCPSHTRSLRGPESRRRADTDWGPTRMAREREGLLAARVRRWTDRTDVQLHGVCLSFGAALRARDHEGKCWRACRFETTDQTSLLWLALGRPVSSGFEGVEFRPWTPGFYGARRSRVPRHGSCGKKKGRLLSYVWFGRSSGCKVQHQGCVD